jgi:hypothetical protein
MPLLLKRLIYILLTQIFIYSFFTEWSIAILDNLSVNFYLQIIVFIFLVIPLVCLTFLRVKTYKFEFEIKNVLPFILTYIFLPVVHFLILVKYEIFNRRIGTETIALVYGDMNGIDKFLMRIYDFSQFAYLIICFFILKYALSFRYRTTFKIVFYFNFAYITIFSLFNSRASLVVLFLLIFIIDGLFNSISKRAKKLFIILGLFFFVTASSIRYVPLLLIADVEVNDIFKNEFLLRANCSKFFNEVYDATKSKGLLYGETISTPFLSLRAIFGSESAKDKIRNAETGSKQYILSNFLYKDNKDDCSCAVVDSYANFGVFGIIILNVIYMFWMFFIFKIINFPIIKSYQLLLLIFITSSIMLYEIDGFSLLFSFVKITPVLILYYFLNPVILKRIYV